MVDVTAWLRRDRTVAATAGPLEDGFVETAVTAATQDSLAAYARFARAGIAAPAQCAEWVESWADDATADCVVARIGPATRPLLALAMEVVRSGPLKVLRFMGGSHANGNFPVLDRSRIAELTPARLAQLWAEIRKSRPDIDLVHFERLAPELDGTPNPLLQLPRSPSPDVALAVDLAGGFDAVLDRTSGKRKRKKHRSQTRKFEAAGGFRRIEARAPEEVDRFLSAFFEMKEQRFRTIGVANVFGDPLTQRFFGDVFKAGLGPPPHFVLHGLEVDGRLRAVTGSSICGGRIVCEFGAIAEDELAHASPGDFLFFENIREAAQKGFALYDFSIGDEPYKRLWCDIEVTQFDVAVPLTLKGRAYASMLRLAGAAKRRVKSNSSLWGMIKRQRRRKSIASRPNAAED